MSAGLGKCSKIRHIVRLRQMLRRWRSKAAQRRLVPTDVPAGHVAVAVGPSRRRFMVRAAYLNHPVLRNLLAQAEEEFGFAGGPPGPLSIPSCDESLFEEILGFLRRSEPSAARFATLEDFQRSSRHHHHCHQLGLRHVSDSRPLLEKPVVSWS